VKTHERAIAFGIPGDDQGARCVMVHGTKPTLPGVPDKAVVPVGAQASALAFLHVGTAYHCSTKPAGSYEILYEDGSKETFSLRNAIDVAGWLKPGGYGSWRTARQRSYCRNATLGWRGLTLDGRTAELCLTEWKNPKPDVSIREIQVTAPPDEALALFGLTVLQSR
jgi:hypothetical protein